MMMMISSIFSLDSMVGVGEWEAEKSLSIKALKAERAGWEEDEAKSEWLCGSHFTLSLFSSTPMMTMMMMMVYLFSTVNALYIVSRFGWMLSLWLKAARGGGGKMVEEHQRHKTKFICPEQIFILFSSFYYVCSNISFRLPHTMSEWAELELNKK